MPTHASRITHAHAHARRSVHHAGELAACSLHGVLSRVTTNGARDEVAWASAADGRQSATSASAKAEPAKTDLRPTVRAFRLSPRVPLRYCLAFDNGLLLVLTAGHATLDVLHKNDPLVDAHFDPLSDAYLLVGCASGTLHMYDVEQKAPLQTFDVEKGLTSLAWVPCVPGDFITVSEKTGVLRVWNVSQRAAKDTLKAEAGPFHAVSFLEPTARARGYTTTGRGH